MSLSSLAFRRFDTPVTVASSGPLTVLEAAQAMGLGLAADATEAHAIDALRTHLDPLKDNELRAKLKIPDQARTDLPIFLGGGEATQALLEAIHGSPSHIQLIIVAATPQGPTPRPPADPMAYPGRKMAAVLMGQESNVLDAVKRLLDGARERGDVASASVPKAVSLTEVLNQPEKFRDPEHPLEIVLFDIDDTTRRGQMWIEWLLFDVLRYGPKGSVGLGFGRLLKTLFRSIVLRIQEKKHGEADPQKSQQTMGEGIKGLSLQRVLASFERYYAALGNRNISPYMRDEFAHHRVKGRLIVGISASPLNLVQRHAEDIGIPIDNVFGTSVKFDDKGIATGEYTLLRAGEKVRYLEEHLLNPLRATGVPFKIVAGYSDSDSDLPMFDLVREQGGKVIATNAPREKFDHKVLGMGGQVVHETRGWPRDLGTRETTIFSVEGAGTLTHKMEVPAQKPPVLGDIADYGAHVGRVAGGLVVGQPIAEAVTEGMTGVMFENLLDVSSAAAGATAAGLAYFFLPKAGEVSGLRRWLLQDMAPLASAMYFSPKTYEVPFSPTAFFLSAMASTLVTRTTISLLAVTARGIGWKNAERALRGRLQDLVTRPAQMTIFRVLYPVLNALERTHGINLS